MKLQSLCTLALRQKPRVTIEKYKRLSENNRITVGLYKDGKSYVLGDAYEEKRLFYDIGSVSKTFTAHLILKLYDEGKLDINATADKYLPLKKGNYPTIYQLLTHTAGYHHLTPLEVTLTGLIKGGYARRNPYEKATVKTVIKAMERRRFLKPKTRYGYSDFVSAILAAIAEEVTKTPFSLLFEEFIKKDLGLINTSIAADSETRFPLAAKGKKILPFWAWRKENPYIAGGGMVSTIEDVLRYISLQIESDVPYISSAHTVCEESVLKRSNHLMCIGWHTHKNSNQLWHVGGVGTFRASVIINKKLKLGVAVLGNAKGKASANAHYIAKMLYSELKKKKIQLKATTI